MEYYSILFAAPEDRADAEPAEPDFFADLNCDQIVAAVTATRDEYDLKPFFHAPLHRVAAIQYRQEVMRDLEDAALCEIVNAFAQAMRGTRERLLHVAKLHYAEERQAWFLDAVEHYCEAVTSLHAELSRAALRSRGFQAFRDYLSGYADSSSFQSLVAQATALKSRLAAIEYCLQIKGDRFIVRRYRGEADYGAHVEATFAKFKQGAVRDYRVAFRSGGDMNHIEAKIAEFVARLHPELFGDLQEFCEAHHEFMDRTLVNFDREVQFYVAYLDYIAALRRRGLQFCYPRLCPSAAEIFAFESFDLALAQKLAGEDKSVVCNDFHLGPGERVLVISGPNQGGKTTFARAFGQLHYLASIGCPVPGSGARLLLFDRLLTHFERAEKVENLRGKLEDDLTRVHRLVSLATPRSIIIMNEIFTSTTIRDEAFLSKKIMERILRLGAVGVWVTFVEELASFASPVVSMVSTVDPENPVLRTFKIVRKPADGLAYAMAITQKYQLTYQSIRRRIGS